MGEINGRDRGLADVGVGVAGQTPQPSLDRVHALGDDSEVAALDDLLHQPQLLGGDGGIAVPYRHRGGDVGHAGVVGAQLLQGGVGIGGLVRGIAVEQRRRLVGHHLFQDRGDGLALGEPLPPDLRQQLGRVGLVEHDRPRRPAILEGQPVQFVEQAGKGRARESDDGERAQVMVAQARFEPARQRLVGQQRVKVHRRFRHAHALAAGRNRAVQVGQRLGVIEPADLWHEAFDQIEHPVAAVGEALEQLPRIDAVGRAALVEPAFGPRGFLGQRHPQQRQVIAALEMRAIFAELFAPLHIDERRDGIGKGRLRVVERGRPLRLDEDRPSRAEPAQRIVESRGGGDQFGGRGGIKVRSPEARRSLKAAVLVEHDAFADQRRPRQEVGEMRRPVAVFAQAHHGRIHVG